MLLNDLDEKTYEHADSVIDIWLAITNSMGDFESPDTKEIVSALLTIATVISRK